MTNFVNVNLILENEVKVVSVPYTNETTAEDVCLNICKQENIGTLARHIFALRIAGKNIFLMPSATFNDENRNVDFRVRFKVANIAKLKKIDSSAYDYYFRQARNDVLENKVPDLNCDKYRKELVGLGISDMYRVMLEKDIKRECIVSEYKKYIPKEVLRKHQFFIKKPIHDTLSKLQKSGHTAEYVKAEYLKQLDIIAPEYLSESYGAVTDQNKSNVKITIKVSPYHPNHPGLMYCHESRNEHWIHICTIEELCFISIRNDDGTVEISRKNGIPFYLKFYSSPVMLSFISLLDGYYRLTCKWIFNICKEVPTPSLKKLYAMKCHGPVGGEFAHWKLLAKRNNRPGCFLIRESETKYNQYCVDVCLKDSSRKPQWFKLEKISDNRFIFHDDLTTYTSINQLLQAYKDPKGPIYLEECLPPSEYDISPLLLCRNDSVVGDLLTDSANLDVMPSSPLCINWKDLQVFKGQKKEGLRGITTVYKGMWKVTKGKKIEVAMKMLKQEELERFLKDYLAIAGQWAFIQSSNIVKLYGIAFASNISLIMEYFKLGPLDQYLRKYKHKLKNEDLIEAASSLASALWHLKENNIVHGRIRCRKLMVHAHTENSFIVKLTDPGVHTDYSSSEVHWIPVECYSNLDYTKRSTAADVWAFATTLWEIFSFAEEIQPTDHNKAKSYYLSQKRQRKPQKCMDEIYSLMLECWHADPQKRKQPQEIMRDLNQILYQMYNSRRSHSYAKMSSKLKPPLDNIDAKSLCSTNTIDTESTLLTSDILIDASEITKMTEVPYNSIGGSQGWDLETLTNTSLVSLTDPVLFDSTLSTSLSSIQSVFELDENFRVIPQGRIGQGFYGEVYRGILEPYYDGNFTPRQVAVKKLKASAVSSFQDFEREIKIMKTLQHPNIVEILGVLREEEIALVMEYVPHSSLLSYLKINRESLQTNQLLRYALNIEKGMEYLGKKNIVHRDLAARNILVVDENQVKISDFGLARFVESNKYYILKTPNRELPIKWYAPECLEKLKFSVKSDVWSFGVTMCEMFNDGEEPTLVNAENEQGQELQVFLQALNRGQRFPCPPKCPQAVYNYIIRPCWEADPHTRPPFTDLIPLTEELLTRY